MDTNLQARVRDIVQKNEKIAIAVGKTPTLDDMAAALALYLGLMQLGKKASIASPTQPLVEHSSLVGIDRVKGSFEADGGDLVVSFPYREGEIEKVSYTIENGLLNIVVKAGEQGLMFKEQDVRYSRGGGVPQVLFIVGTPKLSDLGSLFNPEALKDTTIINADNKTDNQGFGDVMLVSQTASSVSEIIGELLISLGVDSDVDISQNLLSGVSVGTDNFQSPKTSSLAFEMAASFMKKGAIRQRVQPQVQSEDRVSSFMPEQMLAQGAGSRNGVRNQFTSPQGVSQLPPMPMPTMPRPQRMPMPRPMPRPQPPFQQQPPLRQAPLGQQPQMRPQPPLRQAPMSQPFPQQSMPQSLPQQQIQQAQTQQNPLQNDQDEQFDQNLDQIRNDIQAQGQDAPQGQPTQKPPSDWLTPKVYKGSSNV